MIAATWLGVGGAVWFGLALAAMARPRHRAAATRAILALGDHARRQRSDHEAARRPSATVRGATGRRPRHPAAATHDRVVPVGPRGRGRGRGDVAGSRLAGGALGTGRCWRRSSPIRGSTSACTTPPTCWPACCSAPRAPGSCWPAATRRRGRGQAAPAARLRATCPEPDCCPAEPRRGAIPPPGLRLLTLNDHSAWPEGSPLSALADRRGHVRVGGAVVQHAAQRGSRLRPQN